MRRMVAAIHLYLGSRVIIRTPKKRIMAARMPSFVSIMDLSISAIVKR